MSLADDLRSEVQQVMFDLNAQITQVVGVRDGAKDSGEHLLSLHSHNQNIMAAGNALLGPVQEEIEELLKKYRVLMQGLQDYIQIP